MTAPHRPEHDRTHDKPSPAFNPVALEDVLAARVLRKATLAFAVFIAAIGALLAYAAIDMKAERKRLKEQSREVASQIAAMRDSIRSIETEFHAKVREAEALVTQAAQTVTSAQQYQQALAQQLVQFGALQSDFRQTRDAVNATRSSASQALNRLAALQGEHRSRMRTDETTMSALRSRLGVQVDSAMRTVGEIKCRVLNTWTYQVDEERDTPIANSGVWVRFDDISGDSLTNVTVWGRDNRQVQISRVLRRSAPLDFTIDAERYRIEMLQYRREKKRMFGHRDRAVIALARLLGPTGGMDCAPSTTTARR